MKVTPVSTGFMLAVLLSLALTALQAQEFGKIKRRVALQRKLPPVVNLSGSFAVKASAIDPQNNGIANKFADTLETEILQNDNRLIPDKQRPDTLITCTVQSYSLPRAANVSRTEYNTKGQQVQEQYQEVSGSIVITYQAKSAKTGKVLDSDNVTERYRGEVDLGGHSTTKAVENTIKTPWNKIRGKRQSDDETPHSYEEVSQVLLSKAASDIAARLVRTDERIQVLLARGKLDLQNKLAEGGQWSRMLEQLETMEPLPTKEEDAYRFYNIGVAYEAEAYQADDPLAARKFLDQAAINYGKAIDANPAEKYFVEPQGRIQTALLHYKKLQGQANSSGAVGQASRVVTDAKPGGAPATAAEAPTPTSDVLTNDGVIQLAKAGMDQQNLIATIKQAPSVNFDFSVAGQLKLVQNGINGPVLSAMRLRANPPKSRGAAPASKSQAPAK